MSDVIRQVHAQMDAGFDTMQRGIQGAREVQEAGDRALRLLQSNEALLGQFGDTVQQLRAQLSQGTQEKIADLEAAQQWAVQHHAESIALDHRLAGGA